MTSAGTGRQSDHDVVVAVRPAALRQRAAALYLGVSIEFLLTLPIQPLRIRGNGRKGKPVLLYLISELDAWLAHEAADREPQIQTRRTG